MTPLSESPQRYSSPVPQRYVDANVFLRLLTDEPPEFAERSAHLFKKLERGEVNLTTDCLVIAEVVWVLQSFYGYSAAQIAPQLRVILETPHLFVSQKDLLQEALSLYEQKNIDFTDAFIAARMQQQGIGEIYPWDKDFDRLPQVRRLEP